MSLTPLPRLMVAPNGARKGKADHPALPITLPEIIETAHACHRARADGLHLHLRDAGGVHILDSGLYREALAALGEAVPDLAVQVTTEAVGLYTPAEQRQLVRDLRPALVSVSLAEMLAEGEFDAGEEFYKECAEAGTAVQHILYGVDDLALFDRMETEGRLPAGPSQMLFVLGRRAKDQQSDPADLAPFIRWLAQRGDQPDWAICAFGRGETRCLQEAAEAGGKLRVGFENSFRNGDGTLAKDNAERVAEVFATCRPASVR
ncbi:3-keto-5-aminohexanoate cleavage protein [Sulfitobacter aestuarii]|uniref:3-keto-5-aminohexanoate cleavage protein n=1 Tax=Sulfitobacter aestuarii TaxID=2161676 RepID=A0ABW5TZ19_9RHOB